MTVATTDPNAGAVGGWDPNEFSGDIGLEDVSAGDVVIPRLQINHGEGTFKDNLSGAEYTELTCIILGLVKQRIMWADEMDDGDKPLCKSPDFSHGFPNMRDDVSADKRFPWADSNFEPSNAVPVEIGPGPQSPNGWSSNGLPVLNCASCKFQNWGTGANGKSVPPKCTEQHTYAVLYSPDGETWTPALVTFQRTGIKPSKTYMSSFAQSRQPMFTVTTTISLQMQQRGMVKYSVPVFKKGNNTDRGMWGEFAEQYRGIREFVRSAPRRSEEEGDGAPVPSSNENTAPAATTTPAPAPTPSPAPSPSPAPAPAPTPTPAPAAAAAPAPAAAPPAPPADDDDLPF